MTCPRNVQNEAIEGPSMLICEWIFVLVELCHLDFFLHSIENVQYSVPLIGLLLPPGINQARLNVRNIEMGRTLFYTSSSRLQHTWILLPLDNFLRRMYKR
jgi:hypothetical protein